MSPGHPHIETFILHAPVLNEMGKAPDIINWTPQLLQTLSPVFERITVPRALHVYPDLMPTLCTDLNAHAMRWPCCDLGL